MTETPKIELLQGELAVLNLKPRDRVVMMFPEQLSQEYRAQLSAMWDKWAPGIKCLVMDGGARLGVIRAEGDDAAPLPPE